MKCNWAASVFMPSEPVKMVPDNFPVLDRKSTLPNLKAYDAKSDQTLHSIDHNRVQNDDGEISVSYSKTSTY